MMVLGALPMMGFREGAHTTMFGPF
jgi:hypothetical protein